MGATTSKRPNSFFGNLGLTLVRSVKSSRSKALKENRLFTILLQGAGESGKSTVYKQLILSHGDGFDEKYRVLQGRKIIQTLLKITAELIDSLETNKELYKELGGQLSAINNKDVLLTPEIISKIEELCENEEFIELIENTKEALPLTYSQNLLDLKQFPKWGGENWKPTDEEILKCRSRTVGVTSTIFRDNKRCFEVIDVGGQRGERTKYIHLFNGIHQIIYIAALSDYNLNMWESPSEERLIDSLFLFHKVTKKKEWIKASIILFLNKLDIFQQKYLRDKTPLPKLKNLPIPPTAEQEANDKCELAIEWFSAIYSRQIPPNRVERNFIHITVATESDLMRTIIAKLVKSIRNQILHDMVPEVL